MVKPHLKTTRYTNKYTHPITNIKINNNKFTLKVLLPLSLLITRMHPLITDHTHAETILIYY